MTLTPEPSPFAAALVRHTAVPGMGWARVSGSRNASAHGKGLAQPVPVAGDMRSPGIGSRACQPLPFSARFRQRSRGHLLSGPKHRSNLSRWLPHVRGGPSYGDKHSEGLGFKERDVVPQIPAQKCSLSASTCRLWLLPQAGDGGQEGGCSCPSRGHSQKQYVFLSREIKESGEREP